MAHPIRPGLYLVRAGGLFANLCGWLILPAALTIGLFAAIVTVFVLSICKAASVAFPEEKGIIMQTYFGGIFTMKSPTGEFKLHHS
jgi:hypothetical protein